jgi:hypothetical protein
MNLFTCALGQVPFNAVEEFLGLNLPIDERLPEGPRVDYNISIPQDLGDDVASFANTDGGLIFIGIRSDKERQNVPVEWPGLPPRADYGTQITSRILSTVRPRPDVDVGSIIMAQGTYIYIVRIRPGAYPPYEYQQGNTVRIPLRVHDGKRSATVRDIESLFRRREDSTVNPKTRLLGYLNANNFTPSLTTSTDGREQSEVAYDHQRIVLLPTARVDFHLDTRSESEFENKIYRNFPDHRGYRDQKVRGDYFQLEAAEVGRFPWHYLWRIYKSGALAFSGSIAEDFPNGKPIGDLASNLLSMCALAKQVFEELEVSGDVNLGHTLIAPNAVFLEQFPVSGRNGDYDLVPGIRIPKPHVVHSDRASATQLLDTSELKSPERPVSEMLVYTLRETRGIRFDHERFLEAVAKLEQSLRNRRK